MSRSVYRSSRAFQLSNRDISDGNLKHSNQRMPDNITEDYGWSTTQEPQSCGYVGPYILQALQGLGVHRVLDVGSGNGALCARLAAAGYEVVGVEYDKKGAELARQMCPSIRFYNYGVQDDPAELLAQENGFDAVVSTEVVEHLYSPHLLPCYARSVLRPGGYLLVTTPYHGYLKNLALSIFGAWDKHHTALWHGGHIKFWSRETLTQLLAANGFRVVGFRGVGRLAYLWKSMVLVARKS